MSQTQNGQIKRSASTAYPYRPSEGIRVRFAAAADAYPGSVNDLIDECVKSHLPEVMGRAKSEQEEKWKRFESLQSEAAESVAKPPVDPAKAAASAAAVRVARKPKP